ncbi:hypothetical protein ASD32_09940 [Rhizobium sp. Root483D2]|nr:hypothetical protein ASD32_09940 [Rhizobium sp. Root483D2]
MDEPLSAGILPMPKFLHAMGFNMEHSLRSGKGAGWTIVEVSSASAASPPSVGDADISPARGEIGRWLCGLKGNE